MSSLGAEPREEGAEATSATPPHEDSQEEFDALLHSNVLDTLADFDFSYTGLGGSESDARSPVPTAPSPPKSAGRKRSFNSASQGSSWDSFAPKALSELSASLLAGAWDSTGAPPQLPADFIASRSNPQVSVKIQGQVTPRRATRGAFSAVGIEEPSSRVAGDGATTGGKGCKGRRTAATTGGGGSGGGGKRPLNPDRMERKASREKRRREEVNEKFDQLLRVLEDAEMTSGLEPPVPAEGQTASTSCINGRRVEVLSRTISVFKKLLRERLPAPSEEAGPIKSDNDREESVKVLEATVPASVSSASLSSSTGNMEATNTETPAPPTSATASPAVSTAPPAVHHMTMPVHGHPSLSVPPGFVGMPATSMPHGMTGQPIFIAVPMYMPPGQGVPPGETPSQASQATAVATSAEQEAPALVEAQGVGGSPGSEATLAKKGWGVPPGVGFQSMMALQMPQFVSQALSTEEGDEKPTHAVCA